MAVLYATSRGKDVFHYDTRARDVEIGLSGSLPPANGATSGISLLV